MAAQVRDAIVNGEPHPFEPIADVTSWFEPIENYVDLFQDGSILFWGSYFVSDVVSEGLPELMNLIETA